MKHILDGSSNTMLVGETFHDFEAIEQNGARPESLLGNRQDHWYFGSDDIDTSAGSDPSEGLGSTGVPMNAQNLGPNQCAAPVTESCRHLQLSFGSVHPGGMNAVNCDGSVAYVNEDIDAVPWKPWALATRRSRSNEACAELFSACLLSGIHRMSRMVSPFVLKSLDSPRCSCRLGPLLPPLRLRRRRKRPAACRSAFSGRSKLWPKATMPAP